MPPAALIASSPDASLFETSYDRSTSAPREARDDIVRVLKNWNLVQGAGDLLVIVTELVTNALTHTDSRLVTVSLIRLGARSLILFVADSSPVLPDPPSMPSVRAETGRGLAIVATLSAHLAHVRCRSGKRAVVVYEVPLDE
ncbi:ATP-binding protein [Streptomyces yaizuensis]|uniref:ATP-binding protein n=1 Tax=Streptomyces yaizuensis TaxID=2989713 RepID=A0ABQ5NVM9_9ACTN|nr:ATP-binding protein [Streptomyces sp. YSPA8]GLF94407.1 ATP-binding protein [Streptomyces sp. YSPA8]